MNKDNLDSFENSIKESYKNYELPYSPSAWGSLKRTLFRKRLLSSAAFWGTLIVVGGSFLVGGIYLNLNQPTPEVISEVSENKETKSDKKTENELSHAPEASSSIPLTEFNVTSSNNEAIELSQSEETNPNEKTGLEKNLSNNNPVNLGETKVDRDQNLTIIPSIKTACAGSPVEFKAKHSDKNGSYLWNFGDGSFSNEENPIHIFKKAGTFDISLSITNPNDGQISTVAMRGLITILPTPNAEFLIDFEPSTLNQTQIKLQNTTSSFQTFNWQFSNGQSSIDKSPSLLFGLSGKHQILLDVTNEFGCSDVQKASIRMNDSNKFKATYELRAGKINFLPKELIDNNNFKLIILQNEQPIFESTSINRSWNGSFKSGGKANVGQEFTYVLSTFNGAKAEYNYFQGKIQIVP